MNIKKLIRTTISVIIIVIGGYLIYDNFYPITNKLESIYGKYIEPKKKQILIDNEYKKNMNYAYVSINKDTIINDKESIKDRIYTFLDAGWNNYIMTCDASYQNCINDVKEIVQDNDYLTDLSNFVHPFNSFDKINTSFASSGKITISRKPRYDDEQIKEISQKINTIYNENYDSSKSTKENIKTFHDYIINNTKYDTNNSTGSSTINSSTAYGVLFTGLGICSGYTDTMTLFLEKMGIENYRISSNTHVWNLVYIDGNWLHLDLTWDDPVTSDGTDVISDKYFLITTEELKTRGDTEHNFDDTIYIEAK